ncbi:MAG: hypothetical protein JXR28_02260 [Alphaproteobacteria bacterium]|nr:hypothetical protein [Alphaproteobacteria bacterium]
MKKQKLMISIVVVVMLISFINVSMVSKSTKANGISLNGLFTEAQALCEGWYNFTSTDYVEKDGFFENYTTEEYAEWTSGACSCSFYETYTHCSRGDYSDFCDEGIHSSEVCI